LSGPQVIIPAGEVVRMIDESLALKERWYINMREASTRSERAEAIRNYNALRGVIKALRWAFYKGESPLN
tara:strand:- start:4688 stop:4897 length:210 start_codon:yes stop_codon:yes gene_type:complete